MDIDFNWLEDQIFHRHLSSEEKTALNQAIRIAEYGKGDVLMAEGERCDGLYLLRSGRAGVHHHSHGQQVRVGEVDEGAQLGDMAFFDDQPYSTTITARADCLVYKIPRLDLENIMEMYHALAKDVMLNTICRLSGIVRGMNTVNAYSQQYIHGRRV